MQALFRSAIAAFAALLGLSLFAFTQTQPASGDEVAATRQDQVTLVADEDGDDGDGDDVTDGDGTGTSAGTNGTFDSHTGDSNDGTNSRVTGVTRDRDHSRDDLTKDRTLDGGDLTRDHSRHHTNDASRNDTR